MRLILRGISLLSIFFFLSCNSFLPVFANGTLDTKEKQVRALNAIIDELGTHYGMLRYKEEQFGVNLQEVNRRYAYLIENAMTLEEFYELDPKVQREILSPDQFRQLMIGL